MKRVLFVSVVSPFCYGGGSQATRAYLDSIIEIYGIKNVDIVVPYGIEIPSRYENGKFLFIHQRSKISRYLGFFRGLLGRFSYPVYEYLCKHEEEYGLCVFNGGRESGWVAKKTRKSSVRFVTIHHNQEVEYCMDNKSIYTLGTLWPYTVRKEERNAYRYSSLNLFLTKQDMQAMEHMYGKSQSYLLGCYDFAEAKKVTPSKLKSTFNIVVSGSLVNYQTTHGIIDFFTKYFLIAKSLIPEIKILLTGRDPSEKILQIASMYPDVFTVVASPKDIMTEVQRASIYLCPTDIGGGLKLRAMDGLKNGLPVLIHKISARGYDCFWDKPYFKIYHDELSFKSGLEDILSYISITHDYKNIINHDYYDNFSYLVGTKRMEQSLNNIKDIMKG